MNADWSKTSLGELQEQGHAWIQTGPFGTVLKAAEYSVEGVPVVSVGEIRRGYIEIHERTPRVPESVQLRLPQFLLEEGDIAFGRKGGIDRNALIGPRECGWFLGSDGIRLRLSDAVDSSFVSYQFRSPAIGKWLLGNSSGSIMPSLNEGVLGRLPLWLPELDEQKKIAAVLSALDAKIDLNNRINAELEALAKTIYDYWFVQFDFPDAQGRPYKSSGGAMVWNDALKREIPMGWKAQPLSELGSFRNGINYDPSIGGDSVARIVNVRNVSATSIFLNSDDLDELELDQADIDKYLVTADSILIARSGIPGATRMMQPCPTNTIYCGFIICLKVANAENKLLLFFRLKQLEQSLLSQSSGSILKNVSQDTLKDISLAVPRERSVIEKFNAAIAPLFEKISANNLENVELTQLRDWLLPLLMNGQVRVA